MHAIGGPALRRALFGGTFDPPHVGHLVVAQAAYEQLAVDTVTFLPAGEPWQKAGRPVSPVQDRIDMVQAAIDGIPQFDLDLRETVEPGPTYTWDTVMSFDDEVVLIMGADAAAGIRSWYRASDLLRRVEVAVVGRPGVDRASVESAVGPALRWLEMPALDISSTDLRAWLARGFSGRFLVPEAVRHIIEKRGLYVAGGDGVTN